MGIKKIKKRDGREVKFNPKKISQALEGCIRNTNHVINIDEITQQSVDMLLEKYSGKRPTVEVIQDVVEQVLMDSGNHEVAKRFIIYRQKRTDEREKNTILMNTLDGVFHKSSGENDLKRDNANTNTDTAM